MATAKKSVYRGFEYRKSAITVPAWKRVNGRAVRCYKNCYEVKIPMSGNSYTWKPIGDATTVTEIKIFIDDMLRGQAFNFRRY